MLKKFFKRGKKDKEENIVKEEETNIEEISEDKEEHIEEPEEVEDITTESEIETEEEIEPENESDEPEEPKGLFGKLKKGLAKTRNGITGKINDVLKNYRKIDEDLFEEIEEILISADVGVNITMRIIEDLEDKVKERNIKDPSEIMGLLKEELEEILLDKETDNAINIEPSPAIVLVVGVNGVGKTTSIGKLSAKLRRQGKKVLIAAGDTFRAAAIEQLEEWSNRAGVDIISHQEGADPAAVIFDGIQAAKARKSDVLICDTAGRLHNKKNLMNELNKIFRVVEREYPDATKEVLLVVDATTGQNAIMQAKVFKEACEITGIVLTKLDGTAKGGVVLAVQSELDVPVKLVGVGEQIDDLQEFEPKAFVKAIFED
ncbi:signal recognition particle-docking protein FtsY [Sporosalibacterium faouarense]|uniref:signal recognition particle-docking protein FtsY n=1 Tax=Sporosalibacterium faouarense TaxID=516123 RepID=UPI00192AA78E|nr:signal recognition particle-docking protein FtsY [Sporosalibacterium faouarense]